MQRSGWWISDYWVSQWYFLILETREINPNKKITYNFNEKNRKIISKKKTIQKSKMIFIWMDDALKTFNHDIYRTWDKNEILAIRSKYTEMFQLIQAILRIFTSEFNNREFVREMISCACHFYQQSAWCLQVIYTALNSLLAAFPQNNT